MTPRIELKARVLALAAKEASPIRRAVERRRAIRWLGACVWMLLVFGGLGGLRAVVRPVAFVLGTAAGWAAIALAATLGSSRKRSMLGRPESALLLIVVATPLALEAWYSAWVGRADFAVAASPAVAILHCLIATLAMAAAPFALLLVGRRGSDPNHPRSTGAAMGVVSGAWGAMLIDLHCEHSDLMHVTLGHVLPALLLGLLGFILGAAVLGVRAESLSRPD
jgi:hypothetical protein